MISLAALVLASQVATVTQGNILEALRRDGHFQDTLRMLHTTGLDLQLKSSAPYTLIAAPDAAYRKLPATARAAILNQEEFGTMFAGNQVLPGKYGTMSFTNGISPVGQPLRYRMKTWAETVVETRSDSRGLFIGDARVVREIFAKNGSVLVVDRLIKAELPRPKGAGLERAFRPELIKWGLARYR